MKAITCHKYGPTDRLKVQEVEKPSPSENQVLVKVHFSAVNDYDWSMVRGKPTLYRLLFGLFKPRRPIPGMELSGVVEACGAQVKSFQVGDAVYGDISQFGFGTFAEYLAVNEKALKSKPDGMSFEDAAALSHAANLAWQGLVDAGNIQKGMKVLINGAGGGVGTLGLQIAKTYDAEVTGVDTGEKLKMMVQAGFDHIIDYKETDFTRSEEKYDLILDAKTTRRPGAYARCLTPQGRYATVGGHLNRLIQILFSRLFGRKNMFMVALDANKDLDKIHELYADRKLKPVIDGPFPLEETGKAIQYFGEGKHLGKVLVSIP